MQNSEMINEFLDGGLLPADEDNFLMMLAANDELKSEFKRALFIDNTLKEEAASIAPSTKSTMQLFSALGINNSNFIQGKSFYGKTTELMVKYFKKSIPSIITALIVSAAVSWYFIESKNNTTITSKPANELNEPLLAANSYEPGFPLMSSYQFDNSAYSPRQANGYIPVKTNKIQKRYKSDDVTLTNPLEMNVPVAADLNEKDVIFEYSNVSKDVLNSASEQLKSAYLDFNGSENLTGLKNNEGKKRFSVAFTGNEDKSLKNVLYKESSHPLLARNGLEILYNLNEDVKIGIDLRQEYFFQDFKKYDEKGIWSQYYQHPNLFTAGLVAQIKITRLFNKTDLIGKVGMGYNKAGAVVRGMIGIDYNATKDFGFTLGIENSNQFYMGGSALYVTPKIGLSYGVKFNL